MNRILGLVGGLLIAISPFVPFVSVLGISVTMWEFRATERGVCYFFVVLGALSAIVAIMNKRWLNIANILFGLIGAGLGCLYVGQAKDNGGTAGIGIWMMVGGGLLVLVSAIMGMAKKKAAVAAAA